jgi:hypothetical protein
VQPLKFDYTYLPGGGVKGLEMEDLETSVTLAVPLREGVAPLLLTTDFAAHFWGGPNSPLLVGHPDLPARVYDAYLDVGWRPQFARWLFADFGVTPGVYSDFHNVTNSAFRLRGRGLGIVALSPQWQIVAGVLYVNRLHTKVLPAGGVLWRPNEDTRCDFVFPAPKLAYRLTTLGLTQWWGYLAGEFGGGTWSVERASGAGDTADYSDLRLFGGIEWTRCNGIKAHCEVGYVFGRKVRYASGYPDFLPTDTLMVRAGIAY